MERVRQIQEPKSKGAEAAVVVRRANLAQFFLESPLRDSELDLRRDRRPVGRAPNVS